MYYTLKRDCFVTIRHKQIRKVTASLLNKIFNDRQIEPQLQSLSVKYCDTKTANKCDDAQLDVFEVLILLEVFKALFQVKVSNSTAFAIQRHHLSKCYTINETKKKEKYNERVL